MVLLTMVLNPPVSKLLASITGISLMEHKLAVSAYADDVNLVLSNDKDVEHLQNALSDFGEITGLRRNKQKSSVRPLGQ